MVYELDDGKILITEDELNAVLRVFGIVAAIASAIVLAAGLFFGKLFL